MNRNLLFSVVAAGVTLVGCGSGDINIQPSTTVTDSNNTTNTRGGGSANDICASYVNTPGQRIQGTYDGTNCTYSQSFVGAGNNLKFDLTIQALPNGGAHIFDDGIEMFGGVFDVDNFVALYVRDDSLDLDEGWQGTITNALIVQSETDGNQCIESDGLGSFDTLDPAVVEDFIARGLNTRTTINNMTCLFSPNGAATATHDPGAGLRFREGIFVELNDALVIGSFAAR